MLKIKIIAIFLFGLILSCSSKSSDYPVEKRYWNIKDYEDVILHMKYGLKKNESLPSLNNPSTKAIVEKLVDKNNYLIIIDDKELGDKYKDNIAQQFFNVWNDMMSIYNDLDKKDKLIYEEEYFRVWHFGLELQIKYFEMGNQTILKTSDDTESMRTSRIINSNNQTLISNFNNYLDEVNSEDAFTEKGINLFNLGLKKYVKKMIESIPHANFNEMENKIDALVKKTKYSSTNSELESILNLINSKKTEKIIKS